MKKKLWIPVLLCVMSLTQIKAQTIEDALRYSQENIIGTARFNAMGGAFGALGGDVSAMTINPASSAVFLNSTGTFTLSVNDTEHSSNYFNTQTSSGDTDFNFNQAGGVFVFSAQDNDSGFQKLTLGVNFQVSNNLSDNLFTQGNGNTSIATYFLEQAQGIPLDDLELRPGETISGYYNELGSTQGTAAQNAFLGYQGFLINPVTNDLNNTQYVSNVGSGNVSQQYAKGSNGYTGKYTFNLGLQFTDNYYFGLNVNSHVIDYEETTLLEERNSNSGGTINYVLFENSLNVIGSGFSAQIGGIGKVSENVRLGLTYDTPTWFLISEETAQALTTTRTENNQSITEVIRPNVINIFEEYKLNTPGKLSASAAYIFGKNGLISIDYGYKDYSNIKFRPASDAFFANQNRTIEENLKGSSTINIGGEYRIEAFSLRGGISYQESPYKNKSILDDRNGFSLGLGYKFGESHIDFAYSRAEQNRQQQLFNVGLTDSANVNTVYSSFMFTLGLAL